LVDAAAIDWDLDRMAVVDRNVLRLAVAELLECPDVPTAVVLNEAVELASAYSTDDSGRFRQRSAGDVGRSDPGVGRRPVARGPRSPGCRRCPRAERLIALAGGGIEQV